MANRQLTPVSHRTWMLGTSVTRHFRFGFRRLAPCYTCRLLLIESSCRRGRTSRPPPWRSGFRPKSTPPPIWLAGMLWPGALPVALETALDALVSKPRSLLKRTEPSSLMTLTSAVGAYRHAGDDTWIPRLKRRLSTVRCAARNALSRRAVTVRPRVRSRDRARTLQAHG